jgi:hypothetical protein
MLDEMILNKVSVNPPIIVAAASFIERISFSQLERNMTVEFVCEAKRTKGCSRENREIYGLLKSLILTILF